MAIVAQYRVYSAKNCVFDSKIKSEELSYFWEVRDKVGKPTSQAMILQNGNQEVIITFISQGEYQIHLAVSDGAMPAYACITENIKESISTEPPPIPLLYDIDVPVQVTLPENTKIYKKLDCMILIDTSGSMGNEIKEVQTKAKDIVAKLESGSGDVEAAARGYATWSDYTYTAENTKLVAGSNNFKAQVDAILRDGGASEAHYYAIKKVCDVLNWRDNSLRILIQFTDEPTTEDDSGTTYSEALQALQSHNVHYIHVWSGSNSTDPNFVDLCTATDGNHYELGDGISGIVQSIQDMIDSLSSDLTVECVPADENGALIVKKIDPPNYMHISAGMTFKFTLTFSREKLPAGSGTKTYKFKMNVRTASDYALIEEIPFSVKVSYD